MRWCQKRGDYTTAINKYFAAEAFDPSKKEVVKKKVNDVFKKIDNLRKEAESAKEKAEKEKAEKTEALNRAQKLINTFYFYDNKFALAHERIQIRYFKFNVFYFINKKGDEVVKLGRWNNAEQFDEHTGLSKVTKVDNNESVIFLLDTLGNRYKYTNDINKLDDSIEALDLSYQNLSTFPIHITDYTGLKILWLNNTCL
jgi:hypothetical protein